MPRSQPNYLTTDASGLVQAIFSGGVLLPTPAQSLDDRGASVTWTNGAGGARLAQISTFKLGAPGPIGAGEIDINAEQTDPTVQSEVRLTAKSASAAGQVRIIGGAVGQPSQVVANGKVVARSDGSSDFIQSGGIVAGLGNIKLGFGQLVLAATAGWNTYAVPLGVPVPNSVTRLPFYSVITTAGAAIAASELPGSWPTVAGGNITAISVDVNSSIAQNIALQVMCACFF